MTMMTSSLDSTIRSLESQNRDERRHAAERLGYIQTPQVIESLAKLLLDHDIGVREAAKDSIIKIGGRNSVDAVIPHLYSEEGFARNLACEILELIGNQSLEPIIKVLDDPNHDVRKFVADVLGNIGNREAVSPLIKSLQSNGINVVTSVIESLGKLKDERAVFPLTKMLDGEFVFEASIALGHIGSPKASKALLLIAKNNSSYARYAAIESLGKIGDKTIISDLLDLLPTEDQILQRVVLKSLGELSQNNMGPIIKGHEKKWSIDYLSECLNDSDDHVQHYAMQVLGELNDVRGAHSLLNKLNHLESEWKEECISRLARLVEQHPEIVKEVVLSDEPKKRESIAQVLGYISKPFSYESLLKLVNDPSPEVRLHAASSLYRSAKKKSISILIKLLNDESSLVRRTAADHLGEQDLTVAIEPLSKLLNDQDTEVKETALRSIIAIGGPEVQEILIKSMNNSNSKIRILICDALGSFGNHESFDVIKSALNDEDPEVRRKSIMALRNLSRYNLKNDFCDLMKMRFSDEDPAVRISVMNNITDVCKVSARDILFAGLNDSDSWVSYHAVKCLSQYRDPVVNERLREKFDENDEIIKIAVCEALSEIGGDENLQFLENAKSQMNGKDSSELRDALDYSIGKIKHQ